MSYQRFTGILLQYSTPDILQFVLLQHNIIRDCMYVNSAVEETALQPEKPLA